VIPVNLDDLDSLPALKPGVASILRTIQQDEIDAADIAKSIQLDIGLTARVLRVANSSFYGFSNQIASVKDACILLGKHTVCNLTLSSVVVCHLSSSGEGMLDCRVLWQHGLRTAAAAMVLAKQCGMDEGSAFTGGLLHDLGRVVLAIHFPAQFTAVLDYQNDRRCLTQEAEMAVLGIDHCILGAELAKRWNFPDHLCRVIGSHHRPEPSHQNNLPRLIHVADVISHDLAPDNKGESLIPPVDEEVVKQLGLEWPQRDDLFMEMEEIHGALSTLLETSGT